MNKITGAERQDTVTKIAAGYEAILKSWLTDSELNSVRHRNREQSNPDIDHAHDFCDANMAMLEAFTKVVGREPTLNEDTPESADMQDHDFSIMNDAWVRLT